MADIGLYSKDTIGSVSMVIGKLLESETDYDHIKPLLDAWADLHDKYGLVWFPRTDHTLQRDVVTCLAFLRDVDDDIARQGYVQETIKMAIDPKLGSSPLPQFDINEVATEINTIREEQFPDGE